MGNRFKLTYILNGKTKGVTFCAINNDDAQKTANAHLDLIWSNHKDGVQNVSLVSGLGISNRHNKK